jgi:hypothetical protein
MNVGIGNYCMDAAMDAAVYNTALGYSSLSALTSGDSNTAIGMEALYNSTTGSNNVAIGFRAGEHDDAGADVTTPNQCVIIGDDADFETTNPANEIVIGYGADGNGDNSATIGNSSVAGVYMADDGDAAVYCGGIIMSLNQPAAQAGSMTSEHLDHYEEGTWTPVVDGISSSPTNGYTRQIGFYTKIGNIVHVMCRVTLSSTSGGSGTLQVTGLPFTSSNQVADFDGAVRSGAFDSNKKPHKMIVSRATARCLFGYFDDADATDADWGDMDVGDLSATSDLQFSVTYRAIT